MSQNSLLPDDPKLTAYALGELEGEERAAVEAALRDDPAARAAVEEIRATAAQLTTALATEPVGEAEPVAADPGRRAAILPGRDPRRLDGGDWREYGEKKLISFPRLYYIVGLGAAACFAVVVALRTPVPHPAPAQKTYTEIDLTKLPALTPREDEVAAGLTVVAPDVAVREQEPAAGKTDSLLTEVRKERAEVELKASPITVGTGSAVTVPMERASARPEPTLTAAAPAAKALRAAPEAVPASRNEGAAAGEAAAAGAGQSRMLTKVEQPVPATSPGAGGDIVQLSPFTVETSRDRGYAAGSTLSGSRIALAQERTSAAESLRLSDWQAEIQRRRAARSANTEDYAPISDNDFLGAAQNPLSTFSIDADTAGYANVRRFIQGGSLPPRDAVRIEELLNYFSYDYVPPKNREPFAASLEVASAPWAPAHRLVRIGLKGREVATKDRPSANLVFLIDVSGSMNEPNRLPLVKESMRLLIGKLRADDRVAIVVYSGASGLALPSTPVSQSREILAALDELEPGGSTNGAMGIQLAYDIAKANFMSEGLNRVILCTDGDFNLGITRGTELTRLIEEKAKSGVFLTVLGFGVGNLKDATLEALADKGNGNYGYIDTRAEAEKLLVEQVNGTLMTIAKDVKIQVEFNPAKVASYRLIGYENRLLKKEDFNNDKVDAGEIGAGHTVTALYEIVPVGAEKMSGSDSPAVDELKYRKVETVGARAAVRSGKAEAASDELLTVKIRYKRPDGFFSRRLEFALTDRGAPFADATSDFKFAAAVAGFGMILRDSPHKGSVTLGDVIGWAAQGMNDDASGYRSEFIGLINSAKALQR